MRKELNIIFAGLLISGLMCSVKPSLAFAAGTAAAQFLKVGSDARAVAMGSAFTVICDKSSAIYWNPAGISNIEIKSLSISRAFWLEGISCDWVSYVQPTTIGNFGAAIQYLSYGEILETDETGLESTNFSPYDMAGIISYARDISMGTKNISIGMNMKLISSKIKQTASAIAIDIGGITEINKQLKAGIVIQNLGTKMKFNSLEEVLPLSIKLGGAYQIKENWLAALDLTVPTGNSINIGIGTEYNYKLTDGPNLFGRVGYNTGNATGAGGIRGITLGFGAGFTETDIDYALVPYGDLGITHRISIGMKF